MRNLKRALSLALATVMTIGMMAVGTAGAANTYTDVPADSETLNVEAIEVLQRIGVMVGDENGKFNPEQKVTRNQMATVLSQLMDYDVDSYVGYSPFTDVPNGHWAQKYVAACYMNGLTAGKTPTYYGGDDEVTTAQAALMLMKALGYFQYQSDFNDDWQLATISKGNKIDLFDDVDSGVIDSMTRNDVAQLVLNTLESGMVEAEDNNINVSSNGTSVQVNNVKYNFVTSAKDYAFSINANYDTNNDGQYMNGSIVQLGEKLFDGDLKRTDERDVFGRPGTKWRYLNDDIGNYADKPLAVYTGKVSKGDLYTLLGKNSVNDVKFGGDVNTENGHRRNDLNVYSNGLSVKGDKKAYFLNNSSEKSGGYGNALASGKGVLTEVYRDTYNNIDLVYVGTYVAQANGDFNQNKGTLGTITYTRPKNVKSDDTEALAPFNVNTLDEEDWENLDQFSDEDYIIYTVSTDDGEKYELETLEKAEVVTGTVDAYSKTNSVTLDGTKYDYGELVEGYHLKSTNPDYVGTSKATEYMVGAQANVVLDKNGYVLYVDDATLSVGHYLYINGIVKQSGLGGDYVAKAYFYDGTSETIVIDSMRLWNGKAYGEKLSLSDPEHKIDMDTERDKTDSDGDRLGHKLDGWYSYSTSGSKYNLRQAKTSVAPKAISSADNDLVVEGDTTRFMSNVPDSVKGQIANIEKDGNPVEATFKTDAKANDDTIFVVLDEDSDVTVYTGIENAPDVKVKGGNAYVSYMLEKDNEDKDYASLVFIDAEAEKDTVVIDGGNEDDVMYVIRRDTTYVDRSNGDVIETWMVILNGEYTTIDAKEGEFEAKRMYTRLREDSDGYYEGNDFTQNESTRVVINLSNDADEDGNKPQKPQQVNCTSSAVNIGGNSYRITKDTQITLVYADFDGEGGGDKNDKYTMLADELMVDKDAKHEVYEGLTGKSLDNMLDGYWVEGYAYAVKESYDKENLDSIIVVVNAVYDKDPNV